MQNIKYKNQVAAVIVTYNRLELLKKVVNGLLNQTRKLDKIIIINNLSTDGTLEYLNDLTQKFDNIIFITQPNLGSSGGQFTGSKTACELGYEWIWLMDDDVVAEPKCLENLLQHCKTDLVCVPKRITFEGNIFHNDIKFVNMKNSLKSIWREIVSEKDFENDKNDLIFVDAVTFEGAIFHNSIFEKVGFPEKKFFIYADDTEFSVRLKKKIKNINLSIVKNSIFYRQLPIPQNPYDFDWKTYYSIRNIIAIDVLHGNFLVRLIRPFGYLITWLFRSKNFSNIKTVFRAFFSGYFYKSEN